MSIPSVIVYGPQACGKTHHSAAMAKAFRLSKIVDRWSFNRAEQDLVGEGACGVLYLTNDMPPAIPKSMRRVPCYPFEAAMKLAGLHPLKILTPVIQRVGSPDDDHVAGRHIADCMLPEIVIASNNATDKHFLWSGLLFSLLGQMEADIGYESSKRVLHQLLEAPSGADGERKAH